MKFTLNWLHDYLETTANLDQIVDTLNMIGLEVEDVEDRAKDFAPFVIAKVVEAKQHPNADRLRVCQVDTGTGEHVQVVCGAPNARTGMVGVFAPPGTHIPGTGIDLKPGVIRSVESNGMLCSEREMKISDDHDGIIDLPEDAPIGETYAKWANLDDAVIDIAITPNRGDCLGVYGIARDLAAQGLGKFKDERPKQIAGHFDNPIPIQLNFNDDKIACPVFAGRYIRDVKNGPSPQWMQRRLLAIGLRPINALVDITNYVSYDLGRPLHVYDADQLDDFISARMGEAGENFLALDGKEYQVDETMCVIADRSKVLGLGGIMGGEVSGSQLETTNVFIESAWFDPSITAKTGRKTGIISDARFRFERFVDPDSVVPGIDIATKLVMDLCGGEPSTMTVAGDVPNTDKIIDFPYEEVKRLSGLELPATVMKGMLSRLGFWVSGDQTLARVAVPSWRSDIMGKADLVEEIVRMVGIDEIPVTPLPSLGEIGTKSLSPIQNRRRIARRSLAARGCVETMNWSFISETMAKSFGGGSETLKLKNPIASDLSDMRPSLLPGLLKVAQNNVDRGFNDLALFEVGQVFFGQKIDEQKTFASLLRRGEAKPFQQGRHWQSESEPLNFYDVKADVFSLLFSLAYDPEKCQLTSDAPDWYHPGRSATLRLGPNIVLGWIGELHPGVLRQFDFDGPILAAEICLDDVPWPKQRPTRTKSSAQIHDLMPLHRDFAFIVDRHVEGGQLLMAARKADTKLISNARLFDIYESDQLGENKKSLGIEVTLQPKHKTLTDEEIEVVCNKVVAAVAKKTGAILR